MQDGNVSPTAAGLRWSTFSRPPESGANPFTQSTMPEGNSHEPPIRLLLVDEHAVIRAGLRMLIESHSGITVVGESGNYTEAVETAARTRPQIILLDLDLHGDSGLDIVPELLAASEGVRVLLLTGIRDEDLHRRALRQGAMGIVLKDETADVLIKAIERVHAGEAWIDRTTMGRVLTDLGRPTGTADNGMERIETLTDRERQVVAVFAEGLKNGQIAERLFISETTVRHHLTSIFAKLEVSDRLELLIFAYRHRLAPLPKPPR